MVCVTCVHVQAITRKEKRREYIVLPFSKLKFMQCFIARKHLKKMPEKCFRELNLP